MRAAVFQGVGRPLAIEMLPDPAPGAGELVIRVRRCGVCGSDLHATAGHGYALPVGAQLGHEYAGEVVAVGAGVEGYAVGDRITALPVVGCGRCETCRGGLEHVCAERRLYTQGLAEYARVGARGAVRLPEAIDIADAALVEPLACGRRAVRLAAPAPDAPVLVMGLGPIGLSVLYWLRRAGVRRIAALATSRRRAALAETFAGPHFVQEGEHAAAEIADRLGGPPALVFECAGAPGVLARAIALVRTQGSIVALGFGMAHDPIVPGKALSKDLSLRFCIAYSRADFLDCAEALATDGGRLRAMVTRTASLDAAPEAFEAFRAGEGCKLLIDPWSGT